MPLTYQGKLDLLMHLSDHENWRNTFDDQNTKPTALRSTRFFREINVKIDQCAPYLKNWHRPASDEQKSHTVTKLIIARDLCVEPDLNATNQYQKKGTFAWTARQKPWHDVTQFEGHFVAIPKNFAFSTFGDDFKVETTSDSFDKITAFKTIFNAAQATNRSIKIQKEKLVPYELIADMRSGTTVQDRNAHTWLFQKFETKDAPAFAHQLRKSFNESLRIATPNFFVLNYDKMMSLAALRAQSFATLDLGNTQRGLDTIKKAARTYGLN